MFVFEFIFNYTYSVQFIMQINNWQCPSETLCSQNFLPFKFFSVSVNSGNNKIHIAYLWCGNFREVDYG